MNSTIAQAEVLYDKISELLRHEHDGQTQAAHEVSEGILAYVNALIELLRSKPSNRARQGE